MRIKVFMDNGLKLEKGNNVFSIGAFDGFHRGHHKLIETLIEYRRRGYRTGIISFFPHPDVVLGKRKYQPLFPPEERIRQVDKMELDYFILIKFSPELAKMNAEEFAKKWLKEKIQASVIIAGENFTFGHRGEGNVELLSSLGKKFGFEVKTVPLEMDNDQPISSSRIRDAVLHGRMEEASKLLGEFYYIRGRVVRGEGVGKKIGFPTANLITVWKMLPPEGVYAALCEFNNKKRAGAVHIGPRITFGKEKKMIEVHILEFSGNLYNKEIKISFVKRIRGTVKFKSSHELSLQIRKDVEEIRTLTSSFL